MPLHAGARPNDLHRLERRSLPLRPHPLPDQSRGLPPRGSVGGGGGRHLPAATAATVATTAATATVDTTASTATVSRRLLRVCSPKLRPAQFLRATGKPSRDHLFPRSNVSMHLQ